jgi:hypothetical protein
LLRLFAAYSMQAGDAVHTLTVRLDNATDELPQPSLIKIWRPDGAELQVLYNA